VSDAGRHREETDGRTLRAVRPQPPAPPDAALRALLPPDVDLSVGWRHEAARPVWFGSVWSRLGRADLAWEHWDRVQLPDLQPWIAAERGRVLRELGLHASAESLEWPALLAARDPVDAAMLRVSLTADAVGSGDLAVAERRLAAAVTAVTALADGPRAARQRLRLAWVQVEVTFLRAGAGPDGSRPAWPSADGLPWWDVEAERPGYPADHAWGSDFHTAKGLLFAGVVRGDRRLLDASAAIAPDALAWAVHLARADADLPGAESLARQAWMRVVPPPGVTAAVARTPVARRLRSSPGVG
jgi:hypothetical protein